MVMVKNTGTIAETVTISNSDYHRLDKTATCPLMMASQKPFIRDAMKNGSGHTNYKVCGCLTSFRATF